VSYLIAAPEVVADAAAEVAGIGSAISATDAAAASSTTSLMAAAQDEVSTAIADLFGSYGQASQQLSAQAARYHRQFVFG
jgi:hypothetical protein